jgi:hypothetical protein
VLFVHPGLGTTGPPVRIGVPAEVTILVLRAATRGEAKLGDEGTPAA